MTGFIKEQGIIAPMLANNIDTDVIMPKQFLKGIDRKGLDRGVFFDQRFLANGERNPDFVLNQAPWSSAKFLATGSNFGCGSSREHAVWGLKQLGIRAIIGTSFGGIFFDNCQRNGLLVIELSDEQMQYFSEQVVRSDLGQIDIDLPEQSITVGEQCLAFEIEALRKNALLSGLDAIGSTLQRKDAITQFERKHLQANPWLA
ncbi:3-isopropylmalate dehydratase small subunit [Agaribacter flavus]|uniref:3-isopropylmalate dehydratase small subunit n=1 Tax=Agaribacter flavus TaxID=1902781 RepID=A0ABV7FXN3_9ALTE